MRHTSTLIIPALAAATAMSASALTSTAGAADYYKNKTITIVIGYKPGGSADADGRLIAKHLGKFIPGEPNIIVQNRPGGGGVRAINYAYNQAKPDGLSLFQLGSAHYLQQLAGSKAVKFDVSKMPILGAWTKTSYVLAIRSDKYKDFEAVKNAKVPPKIADKGTGSGTAVMTVAWQKGLNIKLNILPGYGSLAVERGEADGRTNGVAGILRRTPHWIQKNFAPPLVQAGPKRDPRIPNVPTVYDLNPEPGKFYRTVNEGLAFARPYAFAPKTPAKHVNVVRSAWEKMLKDGTFHADIKKRKWSFVPTSHDEVEKFYKAVVADASPDVVEDLKKLFP
jgi:tripartite-type tricarboxylate transporter receptor subunit TctC